MALPTSIGTEPHQRAHEAIHAAVNSLEGGTAGQQLVKLDGTNHRFAWTDGPTLSTLGRVVDVKDYGAKGNWRNFSSGITTTAGSTTVIAVATVFAASDVGKLVMIEGAGDAGGWFSGTIVSYTSGFRVVVDVAPTTTVSAAKGGFGHDDSAAFAAAIAAAYPSSGTNARTLPFGLAGDTRGQTVINIPPGIYLYTQPGAMLGSENATAKRSGLRFVGAGMGVTTIIFKPATASAMVTNNYWNAIKFEHMSFHAGTPGSTWMRSFTTNNAAGYTFQSVNWQGFKYVFELEGSNNNSEYHFNQCRDSALESDGAFLYVSAANTTANTASFGDQFLNYWFFGHAHWSTHAPLVDMAWGGSVHIFGLDVSAFADTASAMKYLFYLRGGSHAHGVCIFEANGVRVEAKSAFGGLLYSEWPQGNVAFRSSDFTSQNAFNTYGDVVYIDTGNGDGANYTFADSQIVGGVRVKYNTHSYERSPRISFQDCGFGQRDSPSDVVVYEPAGGHANLAAPPVRFERCRGKLVNASAATGAAVWDATVGMTGSMVQSLIERQVAFRAPSGGMVSGSVVCTAVLPLNALITSIEVMSPAGASTDTDGGTWTLATTDATPVTIAAVTVPGALSAGYRESVELAVPFCCDTAARRTVTVKATGIVSTGRLGLILVKGYW